MIEVRRRGGGTPAAVFLPYWGGSAATWDAVVERLPRERDVVRYDPRGWGASRGLPGPYGLEQLADDLATVVRELRLERYVLVGHSMGGKVAQLAAARRRPAGLGGLAGLAGLAGLVLVAPAPPEPPATVTPGYRRFLAGAYDSAQTVEQALDTALTATRIPSAVREAIVRDSLAADDAARREWPLCGIAADITAAARAIEAPVLVLAAEHDRVEPPRVLRDYLLPHIPHARMDVVAGSGHLLPVEAPDAVATAVDRFIAAVAGT
ncbi:alpha/beta hydrolase [Microbispora sp. NPDC046933]|uniref:alpha/beta fold hydrolase n=1 Tax=Microbispora sp. NPDC046933 TaxID=3155618 RepID=UPI0033C53C7F